MKILSPHLPYGLTDLEPALSRESISWHFSLQQALFERAAALVRDTELGQLELEDLLVLAAATPTKQALFRAAASCWNHHMFWHSMRPEGGGAPYGLIGDRIEKTYWSHDNFIKRFVGEAHRHYGSGWIWVVADGEGLRILTTRDSDSPLLAGQSVILALDLWEHAYHLDYDSRQEYARAFLERLVDWDFANLNLARFASSMKCRSRVAPQLN